MKRLLFVTLLCLGLYPMMAQEQSATVTDEDYERLIENYLQVQFRTFAFETLELTEEEIVAFDPVYASYMQSKSDLINRKLRMVEEYKEEMAEDDSQEDEMDETGDFIENYWEVEIDEMELKKDYFDRLEDIVGPDRASAFFLLEESIQNRLQQVTLIEVIPMIIDVERKFDEMYGTSYEDTDMDTDTDQDMADTDMNTDTDVDIDVDTDVDVDVDKNIDTDQTVKTTPSTNNPTNNNTNTNSKVTAEQQNAVNAFVKWVDMPNGKVGLDHNYTKNGLNALVTAVAALSDASANPIANMATKKQQVMDKAYQLTVDWKSTMHADWARESFDMIAAMLQELRDNNNLTDQAGVIDQVATAARQMDPDKLMTPQAETIYNFFRKSKQAVNHISSQMSWPTASTDNMNE